MRLDVISDISCPWCAIGVNALNRALDRLDADVPVELHFQPFELNPDMPPEGEDLTVYLTEHLGMSPAQVTESTRMLRERGAAAGFQFGDRTRIWNTFDAHRLLMWADREGPTGSQLRLKLALLRAYHGEDRNPGAPDVLLELAGQVGLDVERAKQVLDDRSYSGEVSAEQDRWRHAGIRSVPTLVIDGARAVSGAHTVSDYESLLRAELR